MNKGTVLEIQKKSILLLTRDGRFVKCTKKQGSYAIGQEIIFTEEELLPNRTPLFSSPFLKPIFILICCFLISSLFFYDGEQDKVMAYVSVDINPSVEASVDSNLRVLRLEAYNAEGKQILKELTDWQKQPLSDVIEQVINQCQLDGYLRKGTQVALTSVVADNNKAFQQKLGPVLQTVRTKYAKESVSIVHQEGTIQMRENAKESNMSTGTYMKKEKTEKSPLLIPKAPSPSEEQHDSDTQEETEKEQVKKEKESSYQDNKHGEPIKQNKEQLSQTNKAEKQIKQNHEPSSQTDKHKEPIKQNNGQLSQTNKAEKQIKQNHEQSSQTDKHKEPIKQNNGQLPQTNKAEKQIKQNHEQSSQTDKHEKPIKQYNKQPSQQNNDKEAGEKRA
ncbi:anti-sigma factor domain-containing protein [Ectobacillus funiculus]|uniref:anti-sigma factor domain-containing protein n=1 Tax=Ectobacillus funiculus TaxID=137993 RepID=UPI0039793D31